jgi:hypothetical protein
MIHEGVGLFSLDEDGYGDSYVYHTVQTYLHIGQIYPDLSNPFELRSIYSPFLYVVLSIPLRITSPEDGYVGPRLLIMASFLVCLCLVASISGKLMHHRCAAAVSLLLAPSFSVFLRWPIQLRGDFLSILFALLAIRLLLSSRPWAPALAGAAAGFALQFKFTYLAAATRIRTRFKVNSALTSIYLPEVISSPAPLKLSSKQQVCSSWFSQL